MSILAGCGCILDTLLFTLADEGTCVGIPAPYYPAFDNDLKVHCLETLYAEVMPFVRS